MLKKTSLFLLLSFFSRLTLCQLLTRSSIEVERSSDIRNYSSIIIGVVTGVLASGFVELIRFWYKNIFDPWLTSKKYDEINLTGVWKEIYKPYDPKGDDLSQNISLEIKQKAHIIIGIGILTTNSQVKEEYKTRKMIIKGNVKNRYVNLNLELDNAQRFGIVNYLLEVTSDGDTMKGFTSYYDPLKMELKTAECTLIQQS